MKKAMDDKVDEVRAGREIREVHTFSRDQLGEIAKGIAKMMIVGQLYVGDFCEQTVKWGTDGSVLVTTVHSPSDISRWRDAGRPK